MSPVEGLDPATSIRHKIAHDLRFFREKAGITGEKVARVLGTNRAAVSNYEHARDGWNLQERHGPLLDALFGLPGHFAWLIFLKRQKDDTDWFGDQLRYEAEADESQLYELAVMPGLLQTESYARAVLVASESPDVEGSLAQRLNRQEVLTRAKPYTLWVILDEGVLDRRIGSAEVMVEQLEHLLTLSLLPHVSVRTVPRSVGWHPGLASSFTIWEISDRTVAYSDTTGGGKVFEQDERLKTYVKRFRKLGALALNEEHTRALIRKKRENLE